MTPNDPSSATRPARASDCNRDAMAAFSAAHGSAVLCDMIGCREHATGEVQTGDEYIPLCELHRQAEMDRLTPKWRPLPPHPPNEKLSDQPPERPELT